MLPGLMVCATSILIMGSVTVGVTWQITVKTFAHTMTPGPSDALIPDYTRMT